MPENVLGCCASGARERIGEIHEDGGVILWALKWRSDNRLEGRREHLMLLHLGALKLFRTRADARAFRDNHYGYIRRRKDLRIEPHGWKFPAIVKVKIVEE